MDMWVRLVVFTVLCAKWQRSMGQNSPTFTDTMTIAPSSTVVMPSTSTRPLCPVLTAPANGAITYGQTNCSPITLGCTVTYTCNEGYTRSGPDTRICNAPGWTESAPSCVIVNCGAPTIVSNAQSTPSGATNFGDTVTYQCNTNYVLVGDQQSTCGADGQWSGSRTCEYKCTAPTLTNGQASYTCLDVNCVVTYTCNNGFTLVGASSRRCVDGEGFSGDSPYCAQTATTATTSLSTTFDPTQVNLNSPTAFTDFGTAITDLLRSSLGNNLQSVVVTAIHPNGTVEFEVVINDNDDAKATLAAAFGALAKGTPVNIQGQNVSVTTATLNGKTVNLADPGTTDQARCETFEVLAGTCPTDTPCQVVNDIPVCAAEDEEDDNLVLVLTLAIGLPAFAIALGITVCCCWFVCYKRPVGGSSSSSSNSPYALSYLPRYKWDHMGIRFNNAGMKGPIYGYVDPGGDGGTTTSSSSSNR